MTTTERPDLIRVNSVSKRFVVRKDNSLKERLVTLGRAGRRHREDFWALKDVDITIGAGTTVGLIGHNGSGKSTLLKVIGGIIDPTMGDVERRGRVAALLELGAGFHPDLTGRENVFLNASILGLSRDETEARLDDILAFASIGEFIDTQVKFYSSGMYVRLAFAVAVHTDPDLLLVDEVLAVGDEAFQRKCMDKIRSFQDEGRTIVLVTHSLGQVVELCDRAVLLHHGEVKFDGDPRRAVTLFRDFLEEQRLEDGAGPTSTPGEALATHSITSVTAAIEGREIGEPGIPGDSVSIAATFDSRETLPDWICAIQIDDTMGRKVFGAGTNKLGLDLEPLTSETTVRLTLPNVKFGAGKYFVNVSLLDSVGRHLADMPSATSFDISDVLPTTGLVATEAHYSVGD